MNKENKKDIFLNRGFTSLDQLIDLREVNKLLVLYDALAQNKARTVGLRSDLAGAGDDNKVERITQIMRPGLVEPMLLESPAYGRALMWKRSF